VANYPLVGVSRSGRAGDFSLADNEPLESHHQDPGAGHADGADGCASLAGRFDSQAARVTDEQVAVAAEVSAVGTGSGV
jgi:hypothetical protein